MSTQDMHGRLARSEEVVRSISELTAAIPEGEQRAALVDAIRALRDEPTPALLRRLETTENAVLLWAVHLVLDKRDVAPCLRWPKRDETAQMLFLTWLADVYWLAKRHPEHRPFYGRWRGLFQRSVGSEHWYKTALWVYGQGHGVGFYHSKGLGLSDEQKQPLMTMVTNSMRGDRDVLRRLPELRERIWLEATRRPDRSSQHTAQAVADRRAELLRLFLLAGRSKTRAAHYYRQLRGEQMSRQALTRHLGATEIATGMRSLSSARYRRPSPPIGGV